MIFRVNQCLGTCNIFMRFVNLKEKLSALYLDHMIVNCF